ncbi:cryptochrome/photolyase family protein [Sphingobium chlorophenolicum]|uniref:DNA photolyase FAD-binding protein n=1 Tax=Sphingobium chlorophenolicum TaxID=46429 RepID=A0A081RE70_SPHCR|nr:deoxyribodipyrimidine photo-lyase [Sphingobium chlorophenolicum]KEQ53493.1 DNA photolyase FAD-binding protein [Sphingobium chlorophenolicum]
MSTPVLLWLRQDLRLADQAALAAAVREGPVIPVYVLDDQAPRQWKMGGASRWWLHHSLASLDASLRERGSRLILRQGDSVEQLVAIAEEVGARRVHALHHYEPWWRNAEKAVAKRLDLCLHDGGLLLPPGAVRTGGGSSYRIYTPFARAVMEQMPPATPVRAPSRIDAPSDWPTSDSLADWDLLPAKPDWAVAFSSDWTPGEAGARANVAAFLDEAADYDVARNLPSQEGTSRLSPHLHFGEVSPAYVWHRIVGTGDDATTFLKELVWRDYAHTQIWAMPTYGSENARPAFDAMPWRDLRAAGSDFKAWKTGRTGYPIVDAGMRQLWTTGWMHNRVRMIAASFLIKHLLIDWRHGARWFWDTLVDASYANNSVNWQWVAGSGVDANIFSRIMAPLTQSEKFDAAGYIRTWVPELAHLDDEHIHDPDAHGVCPPDYPAKRIGHREGRERALAAWGHGKR